VRRFAALVVKELRQHALAVIGITVLLLPIVGLMILGAAINPQNLSYFEALRSGLLLFVPLLGLVLGNRLIVAEYYGRTQLFLEALPIRRWEPVTVKYVLGLATMIAATLGLLFVTTLFALADEPIGIGFIAILAGRSVGFVVALWSFLFLMGFTGRFRLALYVALIFALAAVGELTEFEIARFGPIRLIDETLPYERATFPVEALLQSLGVAAAFVLGAYGLALTGDGSIAEALAKRMSAREKSAVGAALLVGIFTYTTVLEKRRQPEPYVFPEGTLMVEGADAPVQITFQNEEDRLAAASLLTDVVDDVSRLETLVGWDDVAPVRVALRETLDGDTFEPVSLAAGDGVLLRANYIADDIDESGLRAAILGTLIDAHTNGRATFEPQRFFLEGYARYLVEGRRDASERVTWLRALYATRAAPASEEELLAWNRTRQDWGPRIAEGLAAVAVSVLAEAVGEQKVHDLARALYENEVSDHSWVTLRDTLRPFEDVFEASTGMSLASFANLLGENLEEARDAPWAAGVASMPPLSAGIEVEVIEGRLRAVAAQVSQPDPRDEATVATLLHHPLEPLDDLLVELELERDDVAWQSGERQAELRLEGRYGPGERAFFAIEVESGVLGCPIRVAAERRTIR